MARREVRFFNTTGPCNPDDHYMLPPEERLIGAQLGRYIRDKLYWVLHAPRQTGKTTFLQSWMRELKAVGEVVACYVSAERCRGLEKREDAMPALCASIREYAGYYDLPVPELTETNPSNMLGNILGNWAALVAPKPLVLLFDETDQLMDDPMVSFLTQMRSGFAVRGLGRFPVSAALVGVRDLKDYLTIAKGGIAPNIGSVFNIKEDSAVLGNFQREDLGRLFAQRTGETGQKITEEALDLAFEQSGGQPWIVNNLFQRVTMRILDETSTETVTIDHIKLAREQMILARETHLDSLIARTYDPQIHQVMETLLSGEADQHLTEGDAFRICLDLGLVTKKDGLPRVSNPIYKEVLARQMTGSTQDMIPPPDWRWQKADGTLDMDALLREFQKFWRRNSEEWEERADYTEAFPHLLLQAFLQRVANGEGHIEREYAAGRGRMDLAVEYHGQWNIIEIKLLRRKRSFESLKEEGLEQIRRYRERFDPPTPCYLVIFDRRDSKPAWDQRISWEVCGEGDDRVTVLGC